MAQTPSCLHVYRHLYVPLKKRKKVCVRSCSPSLLSHTHAHTRYQTVCIRSKSVLPPTTTTPLCCALWAVNTIQATARLEDTKTSSYLTPDTNLRALTVVYLGIKHRHPNIQGYLSSLQQEQAIEGEDGQSHLAINPHNSLTLSPL